MIPRRLIVAALVGVMGGLHPLATGAVPADDSADTVRLDAVVTDKNGQAVRNLRAEDFELIDSGQARAIDSVIVPAPGTGRLVAIFLDAYHVGAGDSTSRVRAAMTNLVDRQLRPDDLVAVMKPLDPLGGIAISSDRSELRAAVEQFSGRQGDYAPRTPFEERFMSRAPKAADASRSQVVGAAVQALIQRVGQARQGRKALILVSEGFSPASVRPTVYAANRMGVAIYSIDPGESTDTDEPSSQRRTALRAIAEQTGGRASINEGDLTAGLQRVFDDLDGYYLFTYRTPRVGDEKFHPVELRVKRSNVSVRTRTGYWEARAPSAVAASLASSKLSLLPARPAHSSPYIRPWIGMTRAPDGLTNVTVAWESGTTPPRNQGVESVMLKVMGGDGQVVFEDRLAAAETRTFSVAPGRVAFEMAVKAGDGTALDTDYRTVQVPNLVVERPTFATPQFVRTLTARAFAAAVADANATPSGSREFSRAERLLLRIPAYGPDAAPLVVTATLMNRAGNPMRPLEQVAGLPSGAVAQFDLPLSFLAPGEYLIETVARAGNQEARELIRFRVVN